MGMELRMMLPIPLNGMASLLSLNASALDFLSQCCRKPKTYRTQRELNKEKENKSKQSMTMIRGSKSDHDKIIKSKKWMEKPPIYNKILSYPW